MLVRPRQELVHPAVGTVVLAQLGGRDRHLRRHGQDGAGPACGIAVEGLRKVDMPAGRDLAGRVTRPVVQPLRNVAAPAVGAQRHHVGRPGGAHRIEQGLHAGRLPGAGAIAGGAAVEPAIPADVMRLVEEVEDHAVVVLEEARHRAPERGRVVEVGHLAALPGPAVGGEGTLGVPMEVDDRVHAGRVQAADVAGDRVAVVGAAVGGRGAVDAQPAVLVERHAHGVDVPGGHRRHRGGVAGPIEEPVVGHALVLGAGAVHAQQPNRASGAVDEVIAGDPHRQAGRLCRDRSLARDRGRGAQEDGCQQDPRLQRPRHSAHALTGILHAGHSLRGFPAPKASEGENRSGNRDHNE